MPPINTENSTDITNYHNTINHLKQILVIEINGTTYLKKCLPLLATDRAHRFILNS